MEQTLIQQGSDLLIFGMGTVFIFLTLLVIATIGMSQLVGRLFPEPAEPLTSLRGGGAPSPAVPADKHVMAVIEAAVREHRSKRQ